MTRIKSGFNPRHLRFLLEQGFDPATVDLNGCAGYVARTFRNEERREGRKLARLTQTSHRNLLLPLAPELVSADSLFLRHHLRQFVQTFRACVTRQDVVDCNAVRRDFIRQGARKTGETRAQAIRQEKIFHGLLNGYRGYVQYPSPTSLFHSGQDLAREFDRAEECQPDRFFPLLVRQLFESSGRWSTCVRDENVDASESINAGINHALDVVCHCNVSRDCQHVGIAALRDGRGCFVQGARIARAKHQRSALGCEFFSDGASQSTTPCGNECDSVL